MQAELARKEVAEAHALGEGVLLAVEAFEVRPGDAGAAEADEAEAGMELPAQLELARGRVLALVAQRRDAAQRDVGPRVERRVDEA